MAFSRRSDKSIPHIYYMELTEIKRVTEIQDLGIIFDQHLTFKDHTSKVITTANRLTSMAVRFANEINHRMTAFIVYNIYIAPIILYGCIIWDQGRIGISNDIEKSLHFVSRFALYLPKRPNHHRYRPFIERINALNSLTLLQRRFIASIVTIHKILRNELESKAYEDIFQSINTNTGAIRNQHIFNIDRNRITSNSPVGIAMSRIESHRNEL